ncbi:hypothetical protein DdX_11309 [Ditylenchus destructor]|uniref:Uncharacterized protein n=1 Tax=Ditylenchus destructor TaxID=166010 RepID=A0AAD4R4L1_9BILA|nr:hypothetical protein DdX_11309 [Ditylenchus destructor]
MIACCNLKLCPFFKWTGDWEKKECDGIVEYLIRERDLAKSERLAPDSLSDGQWLHGLKIDLKSDSLRRAEQ